VPKQHESGDNSPQLRITKTGDGMLRRLLVGGAQYILGPFDRDKGLRLRKGQPIRSFRKSWTTACEAAGIGKKLFHDFRRSAARNLIRAGVSETVAMQITGHKTRSMFKRYNITDERDIREALRKEQEYLKSLPSETNVAGFKKAGEK